MVGVGMLMVALGLTATIVARNADSASVRRLLSLLEPVPPAAEDAVLSVDPSTVYQTMRGWEAVAQADQNYNRAFPAYAPLVFDKVVELGLNRLRLEVRAGSENSTDSWAALAAAGFPSTGPNYTRWRATRYETINDNADPFDLNPGGFHFSEVDNTTDLVVNPLRTRLAARGESLYVNLNYVAFTGQITSGQYLHHAPDEYAEFMLATFQHMQSRNGWVPDAIEVILEPDNIEQWRSGTLIGQAIVATGRRLAAAGFTPDFIAPSTTCMNNASRYFDDVIAVAEVKTYLKEIAYHRYCGVSEENLRALVERAQAHGLSTSMLEWWDPANSHRTLHEDLTIGRNSAWQQATLANLDNPAGLGMATVDTSDPAGPVVTTGNLSRYTSLYYRHVRQGARRIGVSSDAPALDPLAFVNVNGTHVVVVNALNAGSFSVRGLPEGTYGISYATGETTADAEQTIVSGQSLNASIPAAGVITIFATAPATPQ
jgi:hypothetical protein